jgi:hypothetical protein
MMTIKEYLADHSKKRNLDDAIIKWFYKANKKNCKKNKADWEKIINNFFSETETKKLTIDKPGKKKKSSNRDKVEIEEENNGTIL